MGNSPYLGAGCLYRYELYNKSVWVREGGGGGRFCQRTVITAARWVQVGKGEGGWVGRRGKE